MLWSFLVDSVPLITKLQQLFSDKVLLLSILWPIGPSWLFSLNCFSPRQINQDGYATSTLGKIQCLTMYDWATWYDSRLASKFKASCALSESWSQVTSRNPFIHCYFGVICLSLTIVGQLSNSAPILIYQLKSDESCWCLKSIRNQITLRPSLLDSDTHKP